jgi:hypothetical protein
MSHGRPVTLRLFWSKYTWSSVSFGVRYFARPGVNPFKLAEVSHMGLEFEFEDGYKEVHEALMGKGWSRKVSDLEKWMAKGNGRKIIYGDTGLPKEIVARIYEGSCDWLMDRKPYPKRQTAGLALAGSWIGKALGLSVKDDLEAVNCSEGCARLLFEHAGPGWDLRGGESFDGATPNITLQEYRKKVGIRA